VLFEGIFRTARIFKLGSDDDRIAAKNGNQIVSTTHALTAVLCAAWTLATAETWREASGAGHIGLCVSTAYFFWDSTCMLRIGYQPLAPLLAHHMLRQTLSHRVSHMEFLTRSVYHRVSITESQSVYHKVSITESLTHKVSQTDDHTLVCPCIAAIAPFFQFAHSSHTNSPICHTWTRHVDESSFGTRG
jgi:hypothetical protein